MTALSNHRANLYINDNDIEELDRCSDLIRDIEDEMESKDIGQKRIPVQDGQTEVGSETGIEEDYNKLTPYSESICDEYD
jgi:hypothetical protein